MLILESVDRKVAAVTGLVCFHSRVNFLSTTDIQDWIWGPFSQFTAMFHHLSG